MTHIEDVATTASCSARRDVVAHGLASLRWAHRCGPYQALDLRFGVRCCDAELGQHLATTLADLAVGGSSDDLVWFSVAEVGVGAQRRLVAYAGGRRLVVATTGATALAYLMWALNQEVVACARGAVLVHGAAAERDGLVVMLPAREGAGKTTLLAGLLRRGYRHVSDEVFALDVVSGRVRPFPNALSLKEGSAPLFADLAGGEQPLACDRWYVPASRLGASAAAGAVMAPRVLLNPSYQVGAPAVLTRLLPVDGLLLLADNSFNPSLWGQAGLSAAADMIRGCPVIGRICAGDLSAACDLVDEAVDEAFGALDAGPRRVQG